MDKSAETSPVKAGEGRKAHDSPAPMATMPYRAPASLHDRPAPRSRVAPSPRLRIFGREALNIFVLEKTQATGTELLKTWKQLQAEELKMLMTQPPTNGFEEMIRWTEEGKLWKYPIDNEDGKGLAGGSCPRPLSLSLSTHALNRSGRGKEGSFLRARLHRPLDGRGTREWTCSTVSGSYCPRHVQEPLHHCRAKEGNV